MSLLALALAEIRIWLVKLASRLPAPHGDLVRLLFVERASRSEAAAWLMRREAGSGLRAARRLIRETERLLVHCYLGGSPNTFRPLVFRAVNPEGLQPPHPGRRGGREGGRKAAPSDSASQDSRAPRSTQGEDEP